jgi:hypothetical protein
MHLCIRRFHKSPFGCSVVAEHCVSVVNQREDDDPQEVNSADNHLRVGVLSQASKDLVEGLYPQRFFVILIFRRILALDSFCN